MSFKDQLLTALDTIEAEAKAILACAISYETDNPDDDDDDDDTPFLTSAQNARLKELDTEALRIIGHIKAHFPDALQGRQLCNIRPSIQLPSNAIIITPHQPPNTSPNQ